MLCTSTSHKTLQTFLACLVLVGLYQISFNSESEEVDVKRYPRSEPLNPPQPQEQEQPEWLEPLELNQYSNPKLPLLDGEMKIQGEDDKRKLPEDGIFSEFEAQGFCYKVTYFYTYPMSDPKNPPVPPGFKQAYTAGQRIDNPKKGDLFRVRNRARYFYKDCPREVEEPRYDLCVALMFLWDGDDDIVRFVDYYSHEGVQKFFLYYNGNLTNRKTLPVYDSVEYHDWNYPFYVVDDVTQNDVTKSSTVAKMTFLTKVSRYYLPRCDHLIHVDLDEYLYHKSKSLLRYVQEDIPNHNTVSSRTTMTKLVRPPGIVNFGKTKAGQKTLYSSNFRGIMTAHVPLLSTEISGIEFDHTVDNFKFDNNIIIFHFTFSHKHMSLLLGQGIVRSKCVADLFNKSALTCPEIFL